MNRRLKVLAREIQQLEQARDGKILVCRLDYCSEEEARRRLTEARQSMRPGDVLLKVVREDEP